jgi:hypothetical protein
MKINQQSKSGSYFCSLGRNLQHLFRVLAEQSEFNLRLKVLLITALVKFFLGLVATKVARNKI